MNTKGFRRRGMLPGAMLAALLFSAPSLAADPLQQATATVVKGHQQDRRSQQKIDQLDEAVRAWEKMDGKTAVLEAWVEFEREVSVVAARGLPARRLSDRHANL